MADSSAKDHTGDANESTDVSPGGALIVVTVKTPQGKQEITISEVSSVAEVRCMESLVYQ